MSSSKIDIPWTMDKQIVLFSLSVLLFEKRSANNCVDGAWGYSNNFISKTSGEGRKRSCHVHTNELSMLF